MGGWTKKIVPCYLRDVIVILASSSLPSDIRCLTREKQDREHSLTHCTVCVQWFSMALDKKTEMNLLCIYTYARRHTKQASELRIKVSIWNTSLQMTKLERTCRYMYQSTNNMRTKQRSKSIATVSTTLRRSTIQMPEATAPGRLEAEAWAEFEWSSHWKCPYLSIKNCLILCISHISHPHISPLGVAVQKLGFISKLLFEVIPNLWLLSFFHRKYLVWAQECPSQNLWKHLPSSAQTVALK